MLHRQSEVLNLSVMTGAVNVQLDGISDSCHDDLGFSLLTFSPSKEGLFIASLGAGRRVTCAGISCQECFRSLPWRSRSRRYGICYILLFQTGSCSIR